MKKMRVSLIYVIVSCMLVCLWRGIGLPVQAEEVQKQAEIYINNMEDGGYLAFDNYYEDPSKVPNWITDANEAVISCDIMASGRAATVTMTSSNPDVIRFDSEVNSASIPAGSVWSSHAVKWTGEICGVGVTTITVTCENVTKTVEAYVLPENTELTGIKQTGANELTLEWKKVAGVTGYQVLRLTENRVSHPEVIAQVEGDNVTTTTIYAPRDVEYKYAVITYLSTGNTLAQGKDSEWAEYISFTPIKIGPELKSVQVEGSTFTLKWDKILGVQGYQIYRSTKENGTYTFVDKVGADVDTYSEQRTKGISYFYKVKALYEDGESTAPNSISGYSPISGKARSKKISQIHSAYLLNSDGMYGGNCADIEHVNYYTANGKFYMVCQQQSGKLHIYTFDSKMNYKGKRTIKLGKYDIYGGFYAGSDGNFYVAVGYNNYKEQDNKTVIKVMQYDSKWKLKNTAKIKGSATNVFKGIYSPFSAGSCRMDMNGSTLYIHTARLMYKSSDGLRHQSNISFVIDTKTMKYKVAGEDAYCSHSFNQFVKYKDNALYLVDHGDAFPRSISLTMIENNGTKDDVASGVDVFKLLGEIGQNYTGATVGGMEIGVDNVLICGTAQPHGNKIKGVGGFGVVKTKNGKYVMLKKNVYLTVTNKETCKNKCIWLTKYNPKTTKVIVGDTRMVKLSDTRFAILYQTTTGKKNVLNYVVVDNNGKKIYSKKYSGYIMNGSSQPILYEGYIQWASSVYRDKKNNYAMMMYQIPANY